MAGERLAKLTVRASWSSDDALRGAQTASVDFRLGSTWVTYRRGNEPDQFVVPDPDDGAGRDYLKQGITSLLALVRKTIAQRGLPYTVSDPRDVSDDPTTGSPRVEFDIAALAYQTLYDLDFRSAYTASPSGWQVVQNQTTIAPLLATVYVDNALIYGSATGRATITVVGYTGPYTYVWADGVAPPLGYQRLNLTAGTYRCTITDSLGASTVIAATVGSDPRLEVEVRATDTSVELIASGGLAPYTYAWDDGPTTATRANLGVGTYYCLVTDARGATRQVEVKFSDYRYYWSQNAISLALDAGDDYRLDPTTKPNLTFLCSVWLEKTYQSGVFEQVGVTLEQPADAQGQTVFEVQALLAAYLSYHVPPVGLAGAQRADSLFRRFFLQHAEKFGDEPVASDATSLERNYVVLGGLSFYQSQARTWFTSYQTQQLPFLTWEPLTKPALADQPEFLYYMALGSAGAFRYRVRLHFSDGSEQVLLRPGAEQVANYEVFCLPVGYQALELASFAGDRRLLWWDVDVTSLDGNQVLSEVRRYEFDTRAFPRRRFFLFATSLGGMATYAALGEAQLDVEGKGEEASISLPPLYDPLLGDTAVQGRTLRPVVKVASGPRTSAQLLASQDLLLSRRVLLLSGARWLPGFIKAKTVTLLDESKLVQTQEFEFTLPTERLYTPDL